MQEPGRLGNRTASPGLAISRSSGFRQMRGSLIAQVARRAPRAEVEGLWRHVAAGSVTLVSTDHVSCSEDRKTNPDMLANASGVPGLEVMMPLFVAGALARDR